MEQIINQYTINKINQFLQYVEKFCAQHDIENDFRTFLFYNWNKICSVTYKDLFLCPKEYLANSVAFSEYYNQLDHDFQSDLFPDGIKLIRFEILRNKDLLKKLQEIQNKDSFF